ncbi:MAG: leucine-rich repeat protein [Clostridiaceae bacterium]|nr:leucine-rich repeat protein [Clostridiaceae bacterium]
MTEKKSQLWKKGIAIFCIVGLLITSMHFIDGGVTSHSSAKLSEDVTYEMEIDGSTVNENPVDVFRGLGTVSCNNSSRLLLDYKEEHPDEYWEIMNWLFNPETGCGLTHVKVELGCDQDTSSGAEPSTKRTEDEPANVSRGAGFHFAADAKSINPDITVDILRWGEPGWITNEKETDEEIYAARYKWFKETIDAVYDVYGMKIDYVGACQNEKSVSFPSISDDGEINNTKDNAMKWTIYLSNALKSEEDERYDYSSIKIVVADEVSNCAVAKCLLYDIINQDEENPSVKEQVKYQLAKEFREAVDVVGTHYHTNYDNGKEGYSNPSNWLKELNETYQKEIWNSEDSPSTTVSQNADNATNLDSPATGGNGILDIANRFINGYYYSSMTMMEYQPSVAAYFSGSVYYPKQLMSANHPWSGYYTVDASVPMTMHFTHFIKKGWKYIDSACYGDGEKDRPILNTTRNEMTAMDPETEDYSSVITNDSAYTRTYNISVTNLDSASKEVAVWETKASGSTSNYDENWLRKIDTITPTQGSDGIYTYTVEVAPYTIVTLTTTDGQKEYQEIAEMTSANDTSLDQPLALEYTDDFEYADYSEDYLESRGGTPRYTTDLNGAFEVVEQNNGNHALMQQIYDGNETVGWSGGAGADPSTSLGDDTWANYQVSIDTCFDERGTDDNYVTLTARYSCTSADTGYTLKLYQNGKWSFESAEKTYASGTLEELKEWNTLTVAVNGTTVSASVNGEELVFAEAEKNISLAGRVCLGSAKYRNCFDDLYVERINGANPYITRYDDLSSVLSFSDEWERTSGNSYTLYDRTMSCNTASGASVSVTFEGTGIYFTGEASEMPDLQISVNGETYDNAKRLIASNRQVNTLISGLTYGTYTVELTVQSDTYVIDTVEIEGEAASNVAERPARTTKPTLVPTVTEEPTATEMPNTTEMPDTTETPTELTESPSTESPSPADTSDNTLKKGSTATVNGIVYKVTKTGTNPTVAVKKLTAAQKKKTALTIPETVSIKKQKYKVTSISAGAVKNNKKLNTLKIGKNITTVGKKAFYGCRKLKTVKCSGNVIKTVGKKAFSLTASKLKLSTPMKKKAAYRKLFRKAGARC